MQVAPVAHHAAHRAVVVAHAVVDVVAHVVHVTGDGGFLRQLHLRHRQAGLRGLGAGRHITGAEEVEHRRRTQRRLAERRAGVVGVADLVVAGVRCEREGAQIRREPQHRLAQLAGGAADEACLGVQQHGPEGRFHVAARATADAVESRRHRRHVGRARVAGDQALDQLPADEGADVGVVGQRVERGLQARVGVRPGLRRDRHAEEAFRLGAVVLRIAQHRLEASVRVFDAVCRAPEEAAVVGPFRTGPAPAGEHPRHAADVGLTIGRDRRAIHLLLTAVGVQFIQPDRHQLHHLAGEVLVRHAAGLGVGLLIPDGGQIGPHHRVRCHRFEQLAVVAQALVAEHVEVGGGGARVVADGAVLHRDHEDLRQRERDALAQLVIGTYRKFPERVDGAVLVHAGVLVEHFGRGIGGFPGGARGRSRPGQLLVDPGGVAEAHHPVGVGLGRTEGRLRKEARSFGARGGQCHRRGRGTGPTGGPGGSGGAVAAAATAAAAGREQRSQRRCAGRCASRFPGRCAQARQPLRGVRVVAFHRRPQRHHLHGVEPIAGPVPGGEGASSSRRRRQTVKELANQLDPSAASAGEQRRIRPVLRPNASRRKRRQACGCCRRRSQAGSRKPALASRPNPTTSMPPANAAPGSRPARCAGPSRATGLRRSCRR